jgi:putative ABC transport system permease protein
MSSILILSTLVIYKQFSFMKNKELGFDKDQIFFSFIGPEKREDSRKLDLILTRLDEIPGIQTASASYNMPFMGSQGSNVTWEGAQPDETVNSRYNFVSHDYFETFGLDIVEGRAFSKEFTSDIHESCIINETAVKTYGWDNPIGKKVTFWDKEYVVVGVVKDFHPFSVFQRIPPFLFRLHTENIDENLMHAVRITSGMDIREAKLQIMQVYKEFFPNALFEFNFLGDHQDEVTMEIYQGILSTFLFFSIITIAIAIVGMIGLVAFSTRSRTKEIGIRKVHGASSGQIFRLLVKEFILLIVIAVFIAFPAGIGFKSVDPAAYKANTQVWEYLATALSVLIITLLTISFHTSRASKQNPSEALRYE